MAVIFCDFPLQQLIQPAHVSMSQIMSPYLLLVSPSNRSNKPATSSNANASRDIARKMVLTKDELLLWSSNIRGSRPPGKSEPSHFLDNLDYSSLMNLRALLGKLRYIKLTPEILKQTKMKEALTMIARGESRGWPPDIVSQARDLLRSWEAPPEHLNAAASQIKYVGRKIGGKVRRWADGGQHNLNVSSWPPKGLPAMGRRKPDNITIAITLVHQTHPEARQSPQRRTSWVQNWVVSLIFHFLAFSC